MAQRQTLLECLREYGQSEAYPFHMPGHKRQTDLGITSFPNPFSVDITEIDGFDNLHHAEGIIKASMDRAAEIYGSDRTWYLVNGSTCGILSAICGLTKPGDQILMARNSHKSAYHAVILNRLEPVYLFPEELTEDSVYGEREIKNGAWDPEGRSGILGGILPEKVERLLSEHPGVRAVFLTSPTYEGVISDIAAIAEIAHRNGIPLIVDEAHGAHLPFGAGFPSPALECGADVVVQSLHKTLPSLTQTAILHFKSRLVCPEQIERYLPVFQSSSPSYVFLAVMENCIGYMAGEGGTQMEAYKHRLLCWMEEAKKLRHLQVLDDRICGRNGVWDRDPSKLVILPPGGSRDGVWLAGELRERYHLEAEMACSRYVILMTSLMDTEEGLSRLGKALWELDCSLEVQKDNGGKQELTENGDPGERGNVISTWLEQPLQRVLPADAWNLEKRHCPLEEAEGRISGSFLTVYPPGVPMLVPGEEITGEAIRLITENRRLGLTVEGITEQGELSVLCRESDGSIEL